MWLLPAAGHTPLPELACGEAASIVNKIARRKCTRVQRLTAVTLLQRTSVLHAGQ